MPGQVLQRQQNGARAVLHGTCGSNGPLFASVRRGNTFLLGWRKRAIGLARHGRFIATLTGIPPGGPYRVTLACRGETLVVPDVFVGDLWLMAGQSNMEGCAFMEAAPPPHPRVRCFTMARRWEMARDPLHLKAESPDPVHGGKSLSPSAANRERCRARKGAGLGVHFGRIMQKRTEVPQGLIATAHGGTSMQQWSPTLRSRGGRSLYGSMLLSLCAVGQPLAGVLWYQGESEALPALARVYTRRMRQLVAAVRQHLAQPNLPWLIVQIGRFIDDRPKTGLAWPDPGAWNDIQEQQRLLPRHISHCAVVPAIDLELDDLAHVGGDGFAILARRLADVTSSLVHGIHKARSSIHLRSVRFHTGGPLYGPRIEVAFSNVVGGLHSNGPVRGFVLLDRKGQVVPSIHRARILGNRVVLHLTHSRTRGLRLRHGHGLDPTCALADARGMAVPAFGPVPIRFIT